MNVKISNNIVTVAQRNAILMSDSLWREPCMTYANEMLQLPHNTNRTILFTMYLCVCVRTQNQSCTCNGNEEREDDK